MAPAKEAAVSKPDAADRYAAWVEHTPTERFPAGDDLSDLAALGETRYSDVPAEEVARRVAMASPRPAESVADLMAAIRSALRGDSTLIRHQSRHLSPVA
jgi:hypothetical protein